jgi:hypothetical protein
MVKFNMKEKEKRKRVRDLGLSNDCKMTGHLVMVMDAINI